MKKAIPKKWQIAFDIFFCESFLDFEKPVLFLEHVQVN